MGTSNNDIDIGIDVHANADAAATIEILRKKLKDLTASVQELAASEALPGDAATDINKAIGQYEALGKAIRSTGAEQLTKDFRAQGDAIASSLARLGATNTELNRVGNAATNLERAFGAANLEVDQSGKKLLNFGNAADATFQRIPRGARTAANAFTSMAFAIDTGSGSMSSMVRSAGGLAFGLSSLSSSANVVAGAAGIGALITIIAAAIEIGGQFFGLTQKQTAALKDLGNSAEDVKKVQVVMDQLRASMKDISGFRFDVLPIVGSTQAQVKALEQLDAARAKLQQGGDWFDRIFGSAVNSRKALDELRKEFLNGTISQDQYINRLRELAGVLKTNEDAFGLFSRLLRDAAKDAADFAAAQRNVAIASSEAAKAQEDLKKFGPAPELPKKLDEVNQQLIALVKGGAGAVTATKEMQEALAAAQKQWFDFTATEQGAKFAGIGFADAMNLQGEAAKKAGPEVQKAALNILKTATAIQQTQKIIEQGPQLQDLAIREADAAAVLIKRRTEGETAARKLAADQEFEQGKRQLARMSGLASDKAKLLQALETKHEEAIRQIDVEEAQKLTDLLNRIGAERLAAESKLAADEFQVRRDGAKKRFDEEIASINKLKLAGQDDLNARLAAENAYTATLSSIEKERTDKIEEIRIAAQQHLDEITSKSGDTDAERIRQGYKKQLDILEATIKSANTDPAEKAAAEAGKRLIEAAIPIDIARARMAELEKTITAKIAPDEASIQRTSLLLSAHSITERQAREQTVIALTHERDVIQQMLPLLEEAARNQPGNLEAQQQIEAYKTKLTSLNIQIAQTSDDFFKLKETMRGATVDAIAGFLTGLTKLGTQSHTEINSLKVDLQSAQDEMNELLAINPAERTGEQNTRLSQLRAEIASTSAELENAKQSITTWRDLFVDALQAIANALIEVTSRMLATALVERLLGIGAASAVGAPVEVISGEPTVPNVAGGGLILGPGTTTSDSIRANLSNREFVQPAASTDYYGVPIMEAIRLRMIPREVLQTALGGLNTPSLRPVVTMPKTHFNDGGLVAAAPQQFASEPQHVHLFVHTTEDYVVRIMEGKKGRKATLTHIRGNPRQLGMD